LRRKKPEKKEKERKQRKKEKKGSIRGLNSTGMDRQLKGCLITKAWVPKDSSIQKGKKGSIGGLSSTRMDR
jgi:hypothetical protein